MTDQDYFPVSPMRMSTQDHGGGAQAPGHPRLSSGMPGVAAHPPQAHLGAGPGPRAMHQQSLPADGPQYPQHAQARGRAAAAAYAADVLLPPAAGAAAPSIWPIDETCDLRGQFRTSEDWRECLSNYYVFRFEKVAEEDRYDAGGEVREESTWMNARRTQVRFMQEKDIAREIQEIARSSAAGTFAQRCRALSTEQLRQVEKVLEELQENDPDGARFEITLVQLDDKFQYMTGQELKSYNRARGLPASEIYKTTGNGTRVKRRKKKRVSITAYYKRSPRAGVDIELLLKEREQAELLAHQPPLAHRPSRPPRGSGHVQPQQLMPNSQQPRQPHVNRVPGYPATQPNPASQRPPIPQPVVVPQGPPLPPRYHGPPPPPPPPPPTGNVGPQVPAPPGRPPYPPNGPQPQFPSDAQARAPASPPGGGGARNNPPHPPPPAGARAQPRPTVTGGAGKAPAPRDGHGQQYRRGSRGRADDTHDRPRPRGSREYVHSDYSSGEGVYSNEGESSDDGYQSTSCTSDTHTSCVTSDCPSIDRSRRRRQPSHQGRRTRGKSPTRQHAEDRPLQRRRSAGRSMHAHAGGGRASYVYMPQSQQPPLVINPPPQQQPPQVHPAYVLPGAVPAAVVSQTPAIVQVQQPQGLDPRPSVGPSHISQEALDIIYNKGKADGRREQAFEAAAMTPAPRQQAQRHHPSYPESVATTSAGTGVTVAESHSDKKRIAKLEQIVGDLQMNSRGRGREYSARRRYGDGPRDYSRHRYSLGSGVGARHEEDERYPEEARLYRQIPRSEMAEREREREHFGRRSPQQGQPWRSGPDHHEGYSIGRDAWPELGGRPDPALAHRRPGLRRGGADYYLGRRVSYDWDD